MNLSLTKIMTVLPLFNVEVLSEEHFWRICKKLKIIVDDKMPLAVNGYYQRKRGRHYILIDRKLRGTRKWLHTAWHEFGHYLFDAPAPNEALFRRACGDMQDFRERFADAFATICIMPFPLLEQIQQEDISDDPDLGNTVQARIAAHVDFGI